jgi:hypothetical protein
MESPPLEKWQLVELEWVDAHLDEGWHEETDPEDDAKKMFTYSSGYVLHNDNFHITIAQSMDKRASENRATDARMSIPWCSIVSIKELP